MRIYDNGIYRDLTLEELKQLEECNKNNIEIPQEPTPEERIETLEKENKIQDELINTTMLATDEMFMMLEPLLINTLSEGKDNPLVSMYVVMVQRGLKKIEDVPVRYREQVREIVG